MQLAERLERARLEKAAQDQAVLPDKIQYYDEYEPIKKRIHAELIKTANVFDAKDENLRETIQQLVENLASNLPKGTRTSLLQEVYDEAVGFGPLEKLIKDDTITEIMVNGPYQVYVERKGRLELTDIKFKDNKHVLEIIDRIVSPLGRRCDETSPMVDARLPDGSRVNAIIPPVSLIGPTITIRKFFRDPLVSEDLVNFGSVSRSIMSFLDACVKAKANIIVSGGTGSGKTTLLNVLSGFIPMNERIVTIEDSAELQMNQEHIVTLESHPANSEGRGEISIRDLVKNALRMRPDRIIVGECRSAETLDMLQALNTGHDGSMTTIHANTSRDVISRIETMVLMAGFDLPVKAIRQQISSAFDLIIEQARLKDGSRKVMEISEVLGMEGEVITLQKIFEFEITGYSSDGKVMGNFVSTGIRPSILEKMDHHDVKYQENWFY